MSECGCDGVGGWEGLDGRMVFPVGEGFNNGGRLGVVACGVSWGLDVCIWAITLVGVGEVSLKVVTEHGDV